MSSFEGEHMRASSRKGYLMIVTCPYAQAISIIDPTRSANAVKHHDLSHIGFPSLSVRPVADEQPH
jgi:hypothetical protein